MKFSKKLLKRILISLVIIMAALIIGIIIWLLTPYRATESATKLLQSTDTYKYFTDRNLEFIPNTPKNKGVIVYPGGRVEAQAYSYICSNIASEGYTCIIATMPFNLAVFNIGAAKDIVNKFNEVDSWTLVGHSLGGSMAARYLKDNPDKIDSLVLLASYSDVDISNLNIVTISVTATNDKVLSSTYSDNLDNLPAENRNVIIEGGNHAQFGDYGIQDGDGASELNISQQHAIIVEEILSILEFNNTL